MDRRGAAEPRTEPLLLRPFRRFWLAGSVVFVGAALTTVAVDVLVIDVLDAPETEVGIVRAAQFLPYLLIGLPAGAYVDRWRRRPTLVVSNLVQGVLLLAVPVLALLGQLSVPTLALLLLGAGTAAVFTAAAEQSYLPDLVPRGSLVAANARLGQSMTVAQSAGPAVGGVLVGVLSAPATILLGGASRLVAALMLLRVDVEERHPGSDAQGERLWRQIAQGLRFSYGHSVLAPLAVSTHLWFLANSVGVTVLGLFVLRGLGLSPVVYGAVLALAGAGGLVGALLAPRVGRRLGEGNTIILGRALCASAWAVLALAGLAGPDWAAVLVLGSAQLLYGFAMGLEDPSEMAFRQVVTPGRMLGRVNATLRSANRSVAVVGAVLGGVLAGNLGHRPTLGLVTVVFLLAVAVAVLSPVRGARLE